ncbi:DUF3617 domain-containing protein [Sphingomonas sp. H39-1-10]|uniref:DUF3617 domain-containing protein n=1 Tax=Sphingomonas pollutisoli TaxID=3030829 RepID=UPI0023B8C1A2|nr:DUF3617 domain-containing protein [Sphingomonas pollutisoli]MDF0488334.1 DUF3617 domain-containing protein [Sphingomonas pollutisoli]
MRSMMLVSLAACMALGACGKGGESVSMTNASMDQVAKVQAAKLQPGQWEMRMEQISSETTGGSGNLPAMPKMPPSTTKVCLTEAQVNDPKAVFGGAPQMQKNCVYDSFTMRGGKIDAKLHCDMGNIKVEGTNTGTFTETAFTSESHSTVSGLPGGMTTKSHMKMDAKRLGECQPGDLKAGDTKAPPQG